MRIERVQPGCNVAPGVSIATRPGAFVIGRDADVDVTLDDATISRRHIEVRALPQGFAVQCLAQHGSTFVDAAPIGPGQTITVAAGKAWIQIGRVLLRVELAASTIPVYEVMTVPEPSDVATTLGTLVRIRMEKIPRVWLGGQALQMFPSAARVFTRLCQSPGDLVEHDALLNAVDPDHAERAGGANLAQLVTYVRDAIRDAIEAGHTTVDTLRALVLSTDPDLSSELGDEADVRALLRVLIPSRRGLGYAIRLPASAIGFE